jgi:hypothetical protein
MKVIPRHESYDSFYFEDLYVLSDLIRFVRLTDDLSGRDAQVKVDGRLVAATIREGDSDVVVSAGQWVVRRPDGLQVLDDDAFQAAYQRSVV